MDCDCGEETCVHCGPELVVNSWETKPGMPTELDGLLREEWVLLAWLGRNYSSCEEHELEAVISLLVANGKRIDKYGFEKEEF